MPVDTGAVLLVTASTPILARMVQKRGVSDAGLSDRRGPKSQADAATDFEVVAPKNPGRSWTVSMALPSSILLNAQSPELRMYLAGQIARAAAIFCIDEIVIFDEHDESAARPAHGRDARRAAPIDPAENIAFFSTILRYLETPQYLRKHLFPMAPELRLVGLLNPLALPSHLSKTEFGRWRDGVAVGRTAYPKNQNRRSSIGGPHAPDSAPPTRFVDVGQERLAEIDVNVEVGARVTVDMDPSGANYEGCPGKYLYGRLAERKTPREVDGEYWGYEVRVADSLMDVFEKSSVSPRGYDLVLGTSERGTPVGSSSNGEEQLALPEFAHLLVVFGGVHGLERSAVCDARLRAAGIGAAAEEGSGGANPTTKIHAVDDLFDFYVNTCPQQGSRTIRTEEAVLISLAALQPYFRPNANCDGGTN